jgi:hypothetical protein
MAKNDACQRLFVFIILSVVFLCLGIVSALADGGIKLKVSLDKKEYKTDEPINVTFILQNDSKGAVYVNKRFDVGSESMPKQKQDVYFLVASPSGEKLTSPNNYEAGFPKSDDFVQLKPGAEAQAEYPRNLRGFFEFKDPGTYTVVAVYQNFFGSEIGLEVFKEKITSDPVSLTIKTPDSTQPVGKKK